MCLSVAYFLVLIQNWLSDSMTSYHLHYLCLCHAKLIYPRYPGRIQVWNLGT